MKKKIGFYSNNSFKEFSNFYPAPFVIEGLGFSCVEQYMMYKKAELFDDKEIKKKIMLSNSAPEIKYLGRAVKGFDKNIWDRVKYDIVKEGVRAKFEQNPPLKKKLIETGDAILAEASPYDRVWGIGTSNPYEPWRGLNLLGKIIMEIREELKNAL